MFVSRRTFGILKFDETLFLDYVDWDFCWRASKSHEVLIFKSNKAKIFHQLGSSYLTHWGLSINTMAPSRIYFQIVNTKKLLFKSHVGLLNRLLLFVRIFKFIFISWIYKDFLARYYFIFSAIFNSDISKHLK
jgi:rhamnosyltransferase